MGSVVIADSFKVRAAGYEWNDTMVAPTTARIGVVAPTLGLGFRGNNAFQMLNFVDNQADEVQFVIQLPHDMAYNSIISPHCHISPAPSGLIDDGVYAVKFILEYFWANINEQFPSSPATYSMVANLTSTSNSAAWMHLIAGNDTNITMDKGMSSILVCRLYRDNTVANNLPHPVTLLGFDIHYQIDSLGSEQEFVK